MAFRAVHASWGPVFAHLPDLGCGQAWEAVWKVKPRAPIVCAECDHPMSAKTSRAGMRFFAHAPHAPDCEIAREGESEAHHLLKLELAWAARDAGAHSELEVRGAGRFLAGRRARHRPGRLLAHRPGSTAVTHNRYRYRRPDDTDAPARCRVLLVQRPPAAPMAGHGSLRTRGPLTGRRPSGRRGGPGPIRRPVLAKGRADRAFHLPALGLQRPGRPTHAGPEERLRVRARATPPAGGVDTPAVHRGRGNPLRRGRKIAVGL